MGVCSNGVVHIVDAVLIPNLAAQSIVDTAKAVPNLSSLVEALVATGLDTMVLNRDGPFTVFAPTNAAFAAISSVTAGLSMESLLQVLEYHVVRGVAAKSTDLTDLEVLLPL